jgi:hypothetical protein
MLRPTGWSRSRCGRHRGSATSLPRGSKTGKGQLLRARLPYADNNRAWLGRRISPAWISGKSYWEIPKAWFNDFVERALRTFGQVYVIQPYREQEKCSPACLTAVGHECQC